MYTGEQGQIMIGSARSRVIPMCAKVGFWALLILLFAFLVVPSLIIVPMSLTPTNLLEFPPSGISFHSYGEFFGSTAWMASLVTSGEAAAVAVCISGLFGTLAAIGLYNVKFPGRGLLIALIMLPIAIPLVVLGLGFVGFFAKFHLVATPIGIGLAHAVLALPYVYIMVTSSLSGLNPALIRAVTSCGGGAKDIFRFVYLPTILPGIVGGVMMAFTISFDEVVVAYFLQGPDATTIPVRIFLDLQYSLSPVIAAISTLLLTITTALLVTQIILTVRKSSLSLIPVSV